MPDSSKSQQFSELCKPQVELFSEGGGECVGTEPGAVATGRHPQSTITMDYY